MINTRANPYGQKGGLAWVVMVLAATFFLDGCGLKSGLYLPPAPTPAPIPAAGSSSATEPAAKPVPVPTPVQSPDMLLKSTPNTTSVPSGQEFAVPPSSP